MATIESHAAIDFLHPTVTIPHMIDLRLLVSIQYHMGLVLLDFNSTVSLWNK